MIVICPTAPPEMQGPLADEQDPNFTKMLQYGDLDALIELYGHLRAENPTLDVFHRTTTAVMADDFSSHVILAWRNWLEQSCRAFSACYQSGPDRADHGRRLPGRRDLQV